MRSAIVLLISVGGLLSAADALAQEYTIVEGTFTDATSSEPQVLTGVLTLQDSELSTTESITVYLVDDFEFHLGDQTFLPAPPVEYDGEMPVGFLQIANQLHIEEQELRFFYLRSGGDLIEENEDEVTFRFLDFQPTPSGLSTLRGQILDGLPPSRFDLQGSLIQVDQSFRIVDDSCPPGDVQPPPPDGGGIVIDGGDRVIDGGANLILHSFESFDLSTDETAEFQLPGDDGNIITRVTGEGLTSIGGELVGEPSQLLFVNPEGIVFGDTTLDATLAVASAEGLPSLEELFIRAPDGADVTLSDDGVLTVESSGDIYLEGSLPEIPGVMVFRIVAGGDIIVANVVEWPSGVSLELIADGAIEIEGDLDPPIITPGCEIVFGGLVPVYPAQKIELGTFAIRASAAARPVEIDVVPWSTSNRLRLGTRQRVWVTLFGSDDLDVSDIDRSSLRLGPAAGQPMSYRGGSRKGRPKVYRRDWNRDGYPDLLAVFKLRRLGVAYGDTELCLTAETQSGVALEGCDSIDASPARPRRDRRHGRFKSSRVEVSGGVFANSR
ncbi:MAG: filamentous hemagglutinin N-terminal domain-containing protein [Deltaproteobacteria bacterium]|nr:filamentous hemagglutinin N-terminal domain-containing protein [Deltaproteobacteria bacterium]MBW2725023.1 filamentous hemagglutinin N-terminal domain-containing protein [Deltaproteobacteria bacterium]